MSESEKAHWLLVGARSVIGQALIRSWLEQANVSVIGVSRSAEPSLPGHENLSLYTCDQTETGISDVITQLEAAGRRLTRIVICTGVLHDESSGLWPEKKLEDISAESLSQVFSINAVLPQLWLARLLPLIDVKKPCDIVVFSARVGSIGDNRLGGWYAYRASKAALNMLLKTTAIEFSRRRPQARLYAFHPGTTGTPLSEPFRKNIRPEKVFSPDFVAGCLNRILLEEKHIQPLTYIDWQGKLIDW